jgi:hypothetical protein
MIMHIISSDIPTPPLPYLYFYDLIGYIMKVDLRERTSTTYSFFKRMYRMT